MIWEDGVFARVPDEQAARYGRSCFNEVVLGDLVLERLSYLWTGGIPWAGVARSIPG